MRSNEILLTNTNTCLNGQKCNCYNSGSDWREDSGLLTDKSTLPVTQIRLGDLDQSHEEGYHTLANSNVMDKHDELALLQTRPVCRKE